MLSATVRNIIHYSDGFALEIKLQDVIASAIGLHRTKIARQPVHRKTTAERSANHTNAGL